MYIKLATLFVILLFSACGGNVKKDVTCAGNDWYGIGYDTASRGKPIRAFDVYRDQCGQNLEQGALDAYAKGYGKGIIEYCTYENGYALGAGNRFLNDVCPLEIRTAFVNGYRQGVRNLASKKKELKRINDLDDRELHQEANRISQQGPSGSSQ